MELHGADTANAHEARSNREELNISPLGNHLSPSRTQELLATAGSAQSLATDSGYQDDNTDNHSVHSELLERSSAVSREGDSEPAMHRSFSPLAGLALGFRYISVVAGEESLLLMRPHRQHHQFLGWIS